jgi:DNA-binding beta-propeller fold protein YncE
VPLAVRRYDRNRGATRLVAALAVLILVTAAATSGAASTGAARVTLGQLAGPNGCISQTDQRDKPLKGCGRGVGLLGATAVAVSPDGLNTFVSAESSNAIVAFARNPGSGAIAEQNCVSGNGTSGIDGTKGACGDGDALAGASDVAVSPDGQFVYVTSYDAGGIAVFAKSGAGLKQVGCVRAVRTCVNAFPLAGATAIALSSDGANAYVTAASGASNAVVMFSRNANTGMLAPLGCISDDGHDGLCTTGNALRGPDAVVVSPDGKQVYVGTGTSDSVLTFNRDPDTGLLTQRGCVMQDAPKSGSCVAGKGLEGVTSLALAPDGKTLYATAYSSSAIAVLARSPGSGSLRWIGCESQVYEDEEKDGCGHGRPLSDPVDIVVSKNGDTLYVATSSGLTSLARNPANGALSVSGCLVSEDYFDDDTKAICHLATGLGYPSGLALSPDERNVYLTSADTNSVAVLAPGPAISQVTLSRRGLLSARITCPEAHVGSCSGALALTSLEASMSLGHPVRFHLTRGASRVLRVRLGGEAGRVIARRGRLTAVLAATDASHGLASARRMVVFGSHHGPSRRPRSR